MIESVNASGNIKPVSIPVVQPSFSSETLSDQDKKGAEISSSAKTNGTGTNEPSLKETEKSEQNVEQVTEIVDAVQESLEMLKERTTHLRFSVHEQTDQVMVKVTNPDSGEVIREIPSQEFLDLAAKFEKMVGLMFDVKI